MDFAISSHLCSSWLATGQQLCTFAVRVATMPKRKLKRDLEAEIDELKAEIHELRLEAKRDLQVMKTFVLEKVRKLEKADEQIDKVTDSLLKYVLTQLSPEEIQFVTESLQTRVGRNF